MGKKHFPVGRRPAGHLGLKVKSDLDERLKTASREEMEEMHKLTSYKEGSAVTGVAINSLACALSPSNFVGVGVNARQGFVARRERKKIEQAAKDRLGVDFRKGENRITRIRHQVAGGAVKASMSLLMLGQDDLVSVCLDVGLDLTLPVTEVEHGIKEVSDAFYGSDVATALHAVAELPATEVEHALGTDHSPTWDELLDAPSKTAAAAAVAGIGMAAEANVVMLGVDVAGEAAYKQITRRDKDVSTDSVLPASCAKTPVLAKLVHFGDIGTVTLSDSCPKPESYSCLNLGSFWHLIVILNLCIFLTNMVAEGFDYHSGDHEDSDSDSDEESDDDGAEEKPRLK